MLYSLYEEYWDLKDSDEVSRKSLDTNRIAVKSLVKSGDQQDSFRVSRTSRGTSRIGVKSLGRVWGPPG